MGLRRCHEGRLEVAGPLPTDLAAAGYFGAGALNHLIHPVDERRRGRMSARPARPHVVQERRKHLAFPHTNSFTSASAFSSQKGRQHQRLLARVPLPAPPFPGHHAPSPAPRSPAGAQATAPKGSGRGTDGRGVTGDPSSEHGCHELSHQVRDVWRDAPAVSGAGRPLISLDRVRRRGA